MFPPEDMKNVRTMVPGFLSYHNLPAFMWTCVHSVLSLTDSDLLGGGSITDSTVNHLYIGQCLGKVFVKLRLNELIITNAKLLFTIKSLLL